MAPRTRLLEPDEHPIAGVLLHFHEDAQARLLDVLEADVAPDLLLGSSVPAEVGVEASLVPGDPAREPHRHAHPDELATVVAVYEYVHLEGRPRAAPDDAAPTTHLAKRA